jgi:hypothetical protein
MTRDIESDNILALIKCKRSLLCSHGRPTDPSTPANARLIFGPNHAYDIVITCAPEGLPSHKTRYCYAKLIGYSGQDNSTGRVMTSARLEGDGDALLSVHDALALQHTKLKVRFEKQLGRPEVDMTFEGGLVSE